MVFRRSPASLSTSLRLACHPALTDLFRQRIPTWLFTWHFQCSGQAIRGVVVASMARLIRCTHTYYIFAETKALESVERMADILYVASPTIQRHSSRVADVFKTNEKFRGSGSDFRSAAWPRDRSCNDCIQLTSLRAPDEISVPHSWKKGSASYSLDSWQSSFSNRNRVASERPARSQQRVPVSENGNYLGIWHVENAQNGTSTRLGLRLRISLPRS